MSIFKILGIEKDMAKVFGLIENDDHKYISVLKNIENILRNGESYGQANVVEWIMDSLRNKNYQKFAEEMNSVDMWGGSGAVWEVNFQNDALQQKFYAEMIELINLMEKTKILGPGIKPLKKLFETDLAK